MVAEDESTGQGCGACCGRGWRWIRRSRADVECRIDGQVVKPVRIACFDCLGAGEVAA
ncbi:hypothetical protein [Streptosporangium longisporum]|uniref:hypothetical protein n=1 Tax=Streptosporangium TaxID=2000 RepID=UPI0031EEE1BB